MSETSEEKKKIKATGIWLSLHTWKFLYFPFANFGMIAGICLSEELMEIAEKGYRQLLSINVFFSTKGGGTKFFFWRFPKIRVS